MKKLVAILLIISNTAFAECDFSTGIEKLSDGRFAYSPECHKKVGKMVEDLKDRDAQVAALNKTIDLKNLQLETQDKRVELWMNTATKLDDKVSAIDKYNTTNHWIYFGIGVITTGLAVWGAGQLRR